MPQFVDRETYEEHKETVWYLSIEYQVRHGSPDEGPTELSREELTEEELVDLGMTDGEIAERLDLDVQEVREIRSMYYYEYTDMDAEDAIFYDTRFYQT